MKVKCYIAILISGICLFTLGIVIYFIIPVIVRQKVNELLPLRNGTLIYQQWQNTTVPAYIQFWYFSVSNPAEVKNGAKPNLLQIGPYTYREHRIKYDIKFNDNGTVSYLQKRIFSFEREKSSSDEDYVFTTVNIPLMVVADKVKNFPDFVKKAIETFFHTFEKQDLFFKTSVKNITWGYIDPFLELAAEFCKANPWVCNSFHFKVDPKIGLFYGKNDTDDLVYTVDDGLVNLDNFLNVNRWNGSNSLSIWNDSYANMINGTDGVMFPPFLNKTSRLYVYQSDICRSIYTTYVASQWIKGVSSYNYEAPDYLFANHTENPENHGFCVDGYCMGAGVLNLTKCIPLAPVVMSQPHFCNAAPKYQDSVDGLHPSSDLKTSLKLEPTTGLPLELQKKLQINIAIEPVQHFMDMDKVPQLVLPVMWLNESALISDELAATIRHMLVVPVTIGEWGSLTLIVLGVLVTLVAIVLIVKKTCYDSSIIYVAINDEENPLNES